MIESMTGFGAAEHAEDNLSLQLEIRSVNHRYLKLTIKVPETWQHVERAIEKTIRARVGRGSVTCSLRIRGDKSVGIPPVNLEALQHYVDQIALVRVKDEVRPTIDLAALMALPGVCELPDASDETRQKQLETVESLAARAIDGLVSMRQEEGRALCEVLHGACNEIRDELATVATRAPNVLQEYHERLQSRVEALMRNGGFELEADGLMREVAIYAERCDISEEITRITSHLNQMVELCDSDQRVGRTLDFLAQELLREANTIASKSNDAVVTRSIVALKGLIDRVKDQVQNVE